MADRHTFDHGEDDVPRQDAEGWNLCDYAGCDSRVYTCEDAKFCREHYWDGSVEEEEE